MYTHDLIIIGAGSAGLPAGMYASRYSLRNIVIGAMVGGALATSHRVDNYPGVISDSGASIMERFREHAETAGSQVVEDEVVRIDRDGDTWVAETAGHETYRAPYILLATGNDYRHLDIPGEKELLGRGVSYCATCDGMFFKKRTVAVVGGGNTAVTEALYLADICEHVHILYRGDTLRAEDVWIRTAEAHPRVTIHYRTVVEEIRGTDFVSELGLLGGSTLAVEGIFVAIGSIPNTRLVDHLNPAKDSSGCLITDHRQQTSIPSLYAAGDITTGSDKFRQTIMSAAEGCLAAHSIHEDMIRSGLRHS